MVRVVELSGRHFTVLWVCGPIRRQQGAKITNIVIGDSGQHIGKPCPGIDFIQFPGLVKPNHFDQVSAAIVGSMWRATYPNICVGRQYLAAL
jgi:hypothetical protein